MAIDEGLQVDFSSDEYEAYVSLPARPAPLPLNPTKLRFVLKSQGIVYGLLEEALARTIESYNAGRPLDRLRVAEGVRPQAGTRPDIEMKFEFSSKPKEDPSGHINYREMSRVVACRAGDVLAVKKKMRPPVNGITVTGKPVTFPVIEDIPLIPGANILREEGETEIVFRAKIDGAVKFDKHILSVQPVLDIESDVDFSVGNIHFDGDVKIGRDVLADFSVEATGKVSIWGSAIACRIRAGDEIDIRGGIIGKSRAEIRSQRSIAVAFAENARLFAQNDIAVRNGIMGSEAHCHDYFATEAKSSRIVESTIIAGRGISTFVAGSPYSVNTKLITGIHTDKEGEYLKVKATLEAKIQEARQIERRYGRAMLENRSIPRGIADRASKDLETWDRLKEEIREVNSALRLLEDLMYDYSAKIVIKEMVYPKVLLKIGKFEALTSREQRNVTVRFSPDENRLVF